MVRASATSRLMPGSKFSKVLCSNWPRLLIFSNSSCLRSSCSRRRHSQGMSWPNRGSVIGTLRRRKPASLQIGQAGASGGVGAPAPVFLGIEGPIALSTSPMLRICTPPAVGGPLLQDRPDVAPVALVVADRLAECFLDPIERVAFGRLDQLVGDDRRQEADILLVEPENIGTLRLDQGRPCVGLLKGR